MRAHVQREIRKKDVDKKARQQRLDAMAREFLGLAKEFLAMLRLVTKAMKGKTRRRVNRQHHPQQA
jgi:hypothetical protein